MFGNSFLIFLVEKTARKIFVAKKIDEFDEVDEKIGENGVETLLTRIFHVNSISFFFKKLHTNCLLHPTQYQRLNETLGNVF